MRDRKTFIRLDMRMRIGRMSGGRNNNLTDRFGLTIQDNASGIIILEADMEAEAFADLLSNREATIAGTFSRSPSIGLQHENRSIIVPFPDNGREDYRKRDATLDKVIKAHVSDNYPGWEADPESGWNSHRVVGQGKDRAYKATIRRWVEPE